MSVKTHYIIAFILSAIPLAALGLYIQLDGYGGEIFLAGLATIAPVWVLWSIVRKHDKRISDKLSQVIK